MHSFSRTDPRPTKTVGDSKVSAKFQVTIAKQVREILDLAPGDLVIFLVDETRQVLVKKAKITICQTREDTTVESKK